MDLLAVGLAASEQTLRSSEATAREMFRTVGSVRGLGDLTVPMLQECGLDAFSATRSLAWMEIGRRVGIAGKGEPRLVSGPEDVAEMLDHLRYEKKEHFVVVLLDAKNFIMRWTIVHIGTLTSSIVGPREVFREAIREGASSIILAHNHPSGDPDPSPEDIEITEKMCEIGNTLDIPVLDHIIIGEGKSVSLKNRGNIR